MSPAGPSWSHEAQVTKQFLVSVEVPLDHVVVFRADLWHAGGQYRSNMPRLHGYGVPRVNGKEAVRVPGEVYGNE